MVKENVLFRVDGTVFDGGGGIGSFLGWIDGIFSLELLGKRFFAGNFGCSMGYF